MTLARSIAAAQTIPVRGDVAGNVERHARLVRAAAMEQVQVLVFPELSLTGYELDLAKELAFSERDARIAPLIELASSCRMTLIVGAPVRLESGLHIGALLLSPDGAVEIYTKHRLGAFSSSASSDGTVPPAENTVFRPGNRDPLLRIGDSTAAVAVCADIGQPSHPQNAAERGADTYLASMFVTPADMEGEVAILRGHAVGHSMAVVLANYGGATGGLDAGGGSAIWSEEGILLAQLGRVGVGLAVAIEREGIWKAQAITFVGE